MALFTNVVDTEFVQNLINIEDGKQGESDEASNDGTFRGGNEWKQSGLDSKRHSEGVLAPTNWKSTSNDGSFGAVSDGLENEKKVKKVKLKVGGVTRTIDAKSVTDGSSSGKSTRFSGASHSLQKFVIQVSILHNIQITACSCFILLIS